MSGSRAARFAPAMRVALGSFVALAVLFIGGALPAFSASPSGGMGAPTATVQVPEHVCAAASRDQWSCDAVRLATRQVPSAEAKRLRAAGLARRAARGAGFAGPAGGFSPGQLASAYSVNSDTPTSQTVAIVDAFDDPTVLADLQTFDSHYDLPAETATSFKVVNQAGGSTLPAPDQGWAGEITLDVQAVRGLCHACKILLVEANSNSSASLATAVNYAASQASIVSNSYGGPEFAPDSNRGAYDHAGVAILASTGDDGWYGWDQVDNGFTSDSVPEVPASYNTVVGVGGTSLHLNPDDTRASETVWNDNGPSNVDGSMFGALGASGGGCSFLYQAQSWQKDVAGYGSLGCGSTLRNGVDIAADGDEFTGYDVCQNYGNTNSGSCGWQTYGGTSLSSPLVAALWGLAGGPANVKYPALTLYGHFQATPSQLLDVTVGGNAYCDAVSPAGCSGAGNPNTGGLGLLDCQWGPSGTATLADKYQCTAQPGYDGVSGVGAPNGTAAFEPLSPTASIQNPGTLVAGASHAFNASASSTPFPGDSITQYRWAWGDGTTTTTTSATTSHTYASAGTKTVTLTVTDGDSSLNGGRTGSKSLQVSVQPAAQTLTVTKSGAGAGAVGSSPTGISCGSTCSHAFATGTSVKLTATPTSGSVFSGWSGACSGAGSCRVLMTQARSVGAQFTRKPAAACIVPKLKGKSVKAAKRALTKAHCRAGKITKKFSKAKKGRVISQKPKPGKHLAAGTKVSFAVSKGRKP